MSNDLDECWSEDRLMAAASMRSLAESDDRSTLEEEESSSAIDSTRSGDSSSGSDTSVGRPDRRIANSQHTTLDEVADSLGYILWSLHRLQEDVLQMQKNSKKCNTVTQRVTGQKRKK